MSGLAKGEVIPGTPYRVERMLGQGGQGIVVEAQHIWLKKRVVVKLLNADLVEREDLGARIQREAQALAEIRHPSIVPVIDGGLTHERHPRPFFVMEFLSGTTLQEVLRRRPNGLSIEFSSSIAIDLLDGLEVAHARQMIHRDIKPGNVFLHQISPSESRGVLLDFGVAKMQGGASRTTAPGFVGTFEYAAPEQLRGEVRTVSDLYNIGLLLFQMISGRHLFQECRTRQEYAQAHMFKKAPRLSSLGDISPALDEIVANALDKDPNNRPPSAYQFASKLRAIRDTLNLEERARAHTQADTDEMPLQQVMALMGKDALGRERGVSTPRNSDAIAVGGVTEPLKGAPKNAVLNEKPSGNISWRSRASAATDVEPPEPRKRLPKSREQPPVRAEKKEDAPGSKKTREDRAFRRTAALQLAITLFIAASAITTAILFVRSKPNGTPAIAASTAVSAQVDPTFASPPPSAPSANLGRSLSAPAESTPVSMVSEIHVPPKVSATPSSPAHAVVAPPSTSAPRKSTLPPGFVTDETSDIRLTP